MLNKETLYFFADELEKSARFNPFTDAGRASISKNSPVLETLRTIAGSPAKGKPPAGDFEKWKLARKIKAKRARQYAA